MTAAISVPDQHAAARQRRLLIGLVASVLFMEFLDGTVITTALPTMARSFGTSALDLNIGISAYLLSLGVFIPISGWMAERFGARRMFMAAIVIFTVASLLCGGATGLLPFVLFRTLQGFGGAMMIPIGRLLVLQGTPKEEMVAANSALLLPALVAPVIGPSIGGAISTYANWRWIFFLNLPLGVAALLAAFILVPRLAAGPRRAFDWSGFLLAASGISSFLYGSEQLSNLHGSILAALLAIAAGGVLMVAAFVHMKRAQHPMLEVKYLKVPTYAVSLRGGSLIRAAVGSAPFLLPLMFQVGFGWSAVRAGLVVMVVFLGNLTMKLGTTPILMRFGFRNVLWWNGLLCALSLLACAAFTPATPLALIVPVLFVSGLARSMQFTAVNTIAFAEIPQPEVRAANALFSTAFQLSIGAGVALGAVAVRLGENVGHDIGTVATAFGYRFAFVLVSAIAFASLWDVWRLAPGSGDQLTGKRG